MHNPRLIVMLFASSLIIMNCTPTLYSKVNVLQHATAKGENVDGIWISQGFKSFSSLDRIALRQIKIDNTVDQSKISKEECLGHMKQYLTRSAYNNGSILDDSSSTSFSIDFIVTHVSPGDKTSRIFAGELGFGHANVQIQAIVYDRAGNRQIEITDSRNNSGAIGIRDTGRDIGDVLVKELIEQITDDILRELGSLQKRT